MKLCSFDARSRGQPWPLPWRQVVEIGQPSMGAVEVPLTTPVLFLASIESREQGRRDEMEIHSVHVAPFSHVSRFTRH
jgi:hypothetical protein